jgi:CBS domain-containing protein
MKIKQIMSTTVDLIDPTTTVAAAAAKMRDDDVGCLLVGRDDRLFGIVTDRDITVRAVAARRNAFREPVWRVMSSEILCCFEDEPVAEAARIMAEHSIRRLPVLDREGLLCGIVSLSDLCGGDSRKKPWQVTFYKKLTDSRGVVHETPVTTVYVADVDSEDEAVAVAGRLLKEDWSGGRWKGAVDGCRVARGGGAPKPFQPGAGQDTPGTRPLRHGSGDVWARRDRNDLGLPQPLAAAAGRHHLCLEIGNPP